MIPSNCSIINDHLSGGKPVNVVGVTWMHINMPVVIMAMLNCPRCQICVESSLCNLVKVFSSLIAFYWSMYLYNTAIDLIKNGSTDLEHASTGIKILLFFQVVVRCNFNQIILLNWKII